MPATWVNGLPQSQYETRDGEVIVRLSHCQSPRPRKLFWISLVSNGEALAGQRRRRREDRVGLVLALVGHEVVQLVAG